MTVKMTESTNDKLVIAVSGKIDGKNSDEFKEQVKKIRDSHPDGDLVLDMDGLEYISSAGLRVILKFSKEEDDRLKLVNVSWDVMEIFSMTGFSEFINITKKMKEISVDSCELLGKGANGEVYRIDDERIVKLFSETASIDVIQREKALSQKAMIYGLPTAISFDIVKCGNRYGAVFELLNAKTLSTTIKNDPSAFDTYADSYVDLYKKLHSTVVKKEDFPSIKEIYYDYIDDCKDWYTPEQLDTLRKIVDSIPDRDTLIHGDYHANNIMIVDGQLLLIDMGDLSFGHPIFDFLATAAISVFSWSILILICSAFAADDLTFFLSQSSFDTTLTAPPTPLSLSFLFLSNCSLSYSLCAIIASSLSLFDGYLPFIALKIFLMCLSSSSSCCILADLLLAFCAL